MIVLYGSFSTAYSQQNQDQVNTPLGQWNCVIYGNPLLGDERSHFNFSANNFLRITRLIDGEATSNSVDMEYRIENYALTFYDPTTGRTFKAQLGGYTLSGEWRSRAELGGWWCSPVEGGEGIFSNLETAISIGRVDLETTVSPTYPLQAIRDVTQGRVVICFDVTTTGNIINPNFIEVSNEVFRAPSLDALVRSKYKSWLPVAENDVLRPACRSFIYRLDYVYREPVSIE